VAELTTEQVFDGTLAQVFEGIRQYAKYPEYLPGVTAIDVLPAKKAGSTCQVRYELKLIKSFYYTLNMFEDAAAKSPRIWWDLDDSNIMKQSNGSWTFVDAGGGKTKATYMVDVAFSGFVPQKIVDQITKANLPMMMKGFQRLIIDSKG
jgi:ribosome-associated toxin RatA of RatAB toxin-antitoxin module